MESDAGVLRANSGETVEVKTNESALRHSARFVREHWRRFAAISAIVLIPCYWHRVIVSADLGSHLYNAWLAQLAERGQAPGLWLARQWTNVLFDYLLSALGSAFGWQSAEKIGVSIAVLIFFWGMFALVSATTRRAPWFLAPCLAMFTYGYTFHMGFFNYYLSLGLSFFGLAIFWRGRGWERLAPLVLAPLIMLAHPLGLIWLAGGCAYIGMAEILPRRYHVLLFLAAAGLLVGTHVYLWHRYVADPHLGPFYEFNGADQLLLFGDRYGICYWALVVFAAIALSMDAIRRRCEPQWWKYYWIPLQLYILAEVGVYFLPRGIHFPHKAAAIALVTERLTSISAAIACCLLGAMKPSKWHLAGFLAIATVFFSFIYQDTGKLDGIERQIERLVSALPPDQRVLGTIDSPPGSRITIQHLLDRACIGRCFSYGNYEPGSAMFRVRALPGNPYAMSDYADAVSMENGEYEVQPEDLPAYDVYECSLSGTDLCIAPLHAGDDNDSLGVHPDDQ